MTEALPVPSPDLTQLVTGGRDPAIFLATGAIDLDLVRQADGEARGAAGVPARQRVLDWGCGCGRLARHWAPFAEQIELHGCDINARLTGWCRDNLPFGQFIECGLEPPLPYADGSFDLIYGISVLTHLTFDNHFLWMQEIWRLLKPDGVAVLTAHGPSILPIIVNSIRAAGPDNRAAVRITLVDEEVFTCIEREGGSNETGNVLETGIFGKIFHPFQVRQYRPRYGLMGIQDTYVLTRKSSLPLGPIADLQFPLSGSSFRWHVPLELDGQSHLGLLAHADDLFLPATVQLHLCTADSAPLGSTPPVPLSDKVGWTGLDKAYVQLTMDGIPPHHGPAVLTVEAHGREQVDRSLFRDWLPADHPWMRESGPLEGATLHLSKGVLF